MKIILDEDGQTGNENSWIEIRSNGYSDMDIIPIQILFSGNNPKNKDDPDDRYITRTEARAIIKALLNVLIEVGPEPDQSDAD